LDKKKTPIPALPNLWAKAVCPERKTLTYFIRRSLKKKIGPLAYGLVVC